MTIHEFRAIAQANGLGTVSKHAGAFRIAVTGKRYFDRVKAVVEAHGGQVADTRNERYPQLMKLTFPTGDTTMSDTDTLEQIVDRIGLRQTLLYLAEVCAAKASHLQENWQDDTAAEHWDAAQGAVERFASRTAISLVSPRDAR